MVLENKKTLLIILILLLSVTLLPFLGLSDFHTKGEPREAVIAYEMIKTNNWVLPHSAAGDMAYKPPFFHWCIATISLIAGGVSEYTSRMPSALALIAMSISFFLFFAKRISPKHAFLSTLIFATSLEVHRAGMNCRVDMVLTAMIVMAIIQLYKWWEHGMKGVPFWGILFMSLGTLTKGPIAFILPCGSMGLFLLINNVSFFKAFFKMALCAVLACILPALWYYDAYLHGGQEFIDLVMEENFGRFLGKMSYESHENPAIYNVMTMIAGYVPWTIMLVFSLFLVKYKKLNYGISNIWHKMINWFRTADRVRVYSCVTAVLIFVFYCIPKSKRSVYLLPVYPFAAIFITDLFLWIADRKPSLWRAFGWIVGSLTMVVIILFRVIKTGIIHPENFLSGKPAYRVGTYIDIIETTPYSVISYISMFVAIFIFLYFAFSKGLKSNGFKSFVVAIALVMGLQLFLDGTLLPTVLNHKSVRNFAHQIEAEIQETPIYGYIPMEHMRFYIINYYLGDRIMRFEIENPEDGYLLLSDKDFKDWESKYGNYDLQQVMRTPHRDTEVRDYINLYKFSKRNNMGIISEIEGE